MTSWYYIAMNDKLRRDVGLLWDYMKLHQSPGAAECLLVLGSRDDRVATYAAQLTQKFIYDHVVVSGGSRPTMRLRVIGPSQPKLSILQQLCNETAVRSQ